MYPVRRVHQTCRVYRQSRVFDYQALLATCAAVCVILSGVSSVPEMPPESSVPGTMNCVNCQVCRVCRHSQVCGYHDCAMCVTALSGVSECVDTARCAAITNVLWTFSRASRTCSRPTSPPLLSPESTPPPEPLHFLHSWTCAATGPCRLLHSATWTFRLGLGETLRPAHCPSPPPNLLHCPPYR